MNTKKTPPAPKVTPMLLSEEPKSKSFWSTYGYLLICMLLPAVMMYAIYLAKEIHPFGNGCVLVLDLNGQYVWFFEALRNFVRGDADLLYSFSRALGGEFLGIYAYYIASPLSFLVCLFPKERMLEALLALFLLKTALCGGTFGYYMHKTAKKRSPLSIIAFSTFYALSSYAVVQQHNTMWIDALMWLPLITLGIEELIKHGKYKLYTIFLAITLFSNFYIGYMVCIYCAVYFFLYYLAHNEEGRNNPLGEEHHFAKSFLRIALYSLIAVGIAAVILLAAYYSLNFGKTTFSDPKWDVKLNFDIADLLYKFLPGSYDTVRPAGLPFVYCGVLTLLLIPAYFLSKNYSMRQKIVSGIFVFILVASFSLNVVDLVWHGFQKPNWLNYRYSFMLCFYLCVLACRAFAEFEELSLRSVMATGGLIALLCVFLQQYTSGDYVNPDDYTCIWFTLLAIFTYLAVLGLLRRSTDKQFISLVLLGVISVEVFLNGLWNLNGLDEDVAYSKYSYYNNFLNKTRPIVEMVQESDDSFYRMEKTFFRKTNDNMALNIRGLSGSTSTLNKETIHFLNKMGYSSKSHWSKYLGGTPVNDSLLGLKYIISDNQIYGNYYEVYKSDPVHGYNAYYNPYALSIAYGVDEDILDFPLGFVTEDASDTEKTGMSALIASVKSKINALLGIDETVNTAEYIDAYDSPFPRLNAIVSAMLGEEETLDIFVPIEIDKISKENLSLSFASSTHDCYTKIDAEKDGVLTYTIEMPDDAELYFYLPTDYQREVKLTLKNGDISTDAGTFNANETNRIISLGMQEIGDVLSLSMKLEKDRVYTMIDEPCFYYINWTAFEDAMDRLDDDQYQITDYTETSFEGTFTASREKELVLSTIAYDKGWKVFVDGEEVETVKALGSLVSFYVEGDVGEEHEIKMVYAPTTVYVGLVISFLSVAILALIIVLESKLKKIKGIRVIVGVPNDEAPIAAVEDEEIDEVFVNTLEEAQPDDTVTEESDEESEEEAEGK